MFKSTIKGRVMVRVKQIIAESQKECDAAIKEAEEEHKDNIEKAHAEHEERKSTILESHVAKVFHKLKI